MIPAIVLAAGASSRMGRPKALLPVGPSPETFLSRILRVLREGGIEQTIVVIGGSAAVIRETLPPADDTVVVENPHYQDGQLSSLLVALEQVDDRAHGVLMTLVDLPLIASATVAAVLGAFRAHPTAAIVRPRRANRYGHPVIFHRRLFSELRAADPAMGAKPVVRAHAADEVNVEIDDDGSFIDVDTPQDYDQYIRPTLSARR